MIGGWTREYAVQLEYDTSLAGVQTMLGTFGDSTYVDFGNTRTGVTGGDATNVAPRFKLLLNNKPDLVTSSAVTDTPKATGTSDKGVDDVQVTVAQPSAFAPELHAHSNIVGMFLALLAQSGYTEANTSSVRVGTMIPYVTPAINVYASFIGIVQKMAASGSPATKVRDENVIMRGCLPSSVKLSAEEGGVLTLSAEVQGAKWANDFNLTGTVATNYGNNGKAFQKSNLKWQNARVLLLDALATSTTIAQPVVATHAVQMQGFELTLTNGLQSKFYNSDTIVAYVLGKMMAEGSFTLPFFIPTNSAESYWAQIADFRNGVVKRLVIYWGTAPTFTAAGATGGQLSNAASLVDGDLIIDMFIQYKSGTLEGDDVLGSNMSFSCIQPLDGTPAIKVYAAYAGGAAANSTKFTKFGT